MIHDVLKSLIPSWRFFVEPEPKIYLLVRCGSSKESLAPWKTINSSIPRDVFTMFFNPRGNLIHAYNNLIRRVVDLCNEDGKSDPRYFVNSHEYKTLHNIVLSRVSDARFYQFAISLSPIIPEEDSADVALLSEICERAK